MFNKWIRIIHRWLVIPLILAFFLTIILNGALGSTSPILSVVGIVGVLSLLSMFVTGFYMFFAHYWAKWRRSRRNQQRGAGVSTASAGS
jgi:hypothetical protein